MSRAPILPSLVAEAERKQGPGMTWKQLMVAVNMARSELVEATPPAVTIHGDPDYKMVVTYHCRYAYCDWTTQDPKGECPQGHFKGAPPGWGLITFAEGSCGHRGVPRGWCDNCKKKNPSYDIYDICPIADEDEREIMSVPNQGADDEIEQTCRGIDQSMAEGARAEEPTQT